MYNFTFEIPTRIQFGEGQLSQLSTLKDSGSKVLLVYGGGSINEATASCRSAFRGSIGSWGQQHGFRVVCPAVAR